METQITCEKVDNNRNIFITIFIYIYVYFNIYNINKCGWYEENKMSKKHFHIIFFVAFYFLSMKLFTATTKIDANFNLKNFLRFSM